ncbi:hypothetical protein DDV96_09360 [Marixanthomonas spongiae]|uniref:Uncharacterized protein n=2 Tax=Marixanthomonas spongiae TaxID=2174845 RepID=A0A2U0I0S6_9FLAO|nr:hypothetical protein DDV96_09360 [Marixanthomonas spongiae]
MIQTLKNNRRDRITKFDKGVDEASPMYGKFVDHKKMSPEAFADFQQKLKETNRKNRRRLFITFGTVMVVIIAIIIYFLFFLELEPAKPIKFKMK